ncbi:cAMP-dependent protein kinase, alpha-catalytic subunit, putative [Entamoeba invadens IP1]|uniref:non-specific serine/threonine protein kinase n=1 Tax=Entamoeba invadens IP1 TaxID=370355 RepID=A0A0A1UEY4_ENTIV|nr:cAMP-dependent protein kinase, alpha-catalytic subunit, putative [Entamoeba invadens IP1]ELP95145.1 cAMP-dependent protein kinase, alpha-catalytic subunit, putative [Entamoeba invadens IP1]|eukprot:XP_004261916.1 cAMP-dependent protein kinase, alpha-catalytic subunit, putative [Entamoeba invadens IP1]
MLVCKLCEHQYKMSQFCDHTRLCELIVRGCSKEMSCMNRFKLLVTYLRDSYGCKMIKNTFKYTQLIELLPSSKVPSCYLKVGKLIEAIKTLCVDLEDVILLTFARAITDVLVTYQKLLIEYCEGKGCKNMWSFLSILSTTAKQTKQEVLQRPDSNLTTVDDFDIVKKFSAGAYSRIYLVKKKSTGDYYAMKVMRKDDMIRKNVVDSVLVEKNFLSNAHNNSVVKLFWAFQDDVNLYLIMEYCPGGDLATLLEQIGCFSEHVAKVYSAEIILSLHYIHALGCVHKDIKPDNILIDKNGHLVLTDFGLSSYGFVSEESVQKNGIFCTPDYAAPEILMSNSYSFASDYFALGCMMFEFVVGYPPFNAPTPDAIFMKIQEGKYCWPDDVEVSEMMKDLVDKLLSCDPNNRPNFNEIEKHIFFKDIHWSTLFDENREDIFVPELENEHDTGYFEDERTLKQNQIKKNDVISGKKGMVKRKESPGFVEFGNFNAKNVDNLVDENKRMYAKEFSQFEADNV